MKKAILAILVMASIALFIVGCQPSGEAFRQSRVRTDAYSIGVQDQLPGMQPPVYNPQPAPIPGRGEIGDTDPELDLPEEVIKRLKNICANPAQRAQLENAVFAISTEMPVTPPTETIGMTDEQFAQWLENFQENFCDASMAPRTPQDAGFIGMSDAEWDKWLENFQENFCDASMAPGTPPKDDPVVSVTTASGATHPLPPAVDIVWRDIDPGTAKDGDLIATWAGGSYH